MTIQFHPGQGVVVICDYTGFVAPEMVKRRPVIVICPKIRGRPRLCTVVPLSTTAPNPVMPYHLELELPFALPHPFTAKTQWVKGDMVSAVSFERLDLLRVGKDISGKRLYQTNPVGDEILKAVHACVLNGIGLQALTKGL